VKIVVQDSSVLLDLDEAKLLTHWWRLGIETHLTSLIASEVDPERHPLLSKQIQHGKFSVHPVSREQVYEARVLASEIATPGFKDISCYLLAREINAALLTGDRRLKKFAKEQGLKAHGTLWIFDTLVDRKILKPHLAIKKLQHLMKIGTFLPIDECQKRIAKWEQS
jgi:predicted nucleic acid-binding protein